MPVYEYECSEHGRFEIMQPISADTVQPCPSCGRDSARKLSRIGLAGVHHTEKLDYNDPVRVYDRQKLMQDTAVKKALADYQEQSVASAKSTGGSEDGE